jgi:putative beta-lysine N-acetyltransferase
MYDTIEKIGNSLIQHGPNNNRIYLMKLHKDDYPGIIQKLDLIANKNNYTKIFTKIPSWAIDQFQAGDYKQEAYIPRFYNGRADMHFLSKFIDRERSVVDKQTKYTIDEYLHLAFARQKKPVVFKKKPVFHIRILNKNDASDLTKTYWKVFRSYPFPIFEQTYIKKTMDENIVYFGVFKDEQLIAVSSSEMDLEAQNAEMTDFATDPEFAGNNLSLLLLHEMETEMRKRKMKMLYTIARCFSAGMNITFAKMQYIYAGTLINNTDISDKIESMNVWYKSIA